MYRYFCNYNPEANVESGLCEYPQEGHTCDGNCLSDIDGDGICDDFDDEINCNDLFISEYVEGSYNNKAIELIILQINKLIYLNTSPTIQMVVTNLQLLH